MTYDMLVLEVKDTAAVIVALYIPPNNTNYYTDIYYDNLQLIVETFVFFKELFIFGNMNSRVNNSFPHNGFQYSENPDNFCNQNGRHLIKILNEYKNLLIVNGICYKNRIMDSNFTFILESRSSQIDFVLFNSIDKVGSLKVHDTLPQSDHCPCSVEIILDSSPLVDIVNECA